jgi:hypothetical protein
LGAAVRTGKKRRAISYCKRIGVDSQYLIGLGAGHHQPLARRVFDSDQTTSDNEYPQARRYRNQAASELTLRLGQSVERGISTAARRAPRGDECPPPL